MLDAEVMHRRRWFTLVTLCLTLLIVVMDNTILNVAIPSLVRDLNASTTELQWIVDSYTIVFAGLLLTAGSLGDRFGRKRALTFGMLIFVGGSIASALQHSATGLIVTRALMGFGGAFIMPSTLSLLSNVFQDPKERARAFGVWSAVAGIAVAAGPITGGFLLNHFSWSSVFWINVPVAAIAVAAGRFVVPEFKAENKSSLDPVGATLSIVGLSVLLFGIIQAPEKGWTSPLILGCFVSAVAVVAGFILWEKRHPDPMLPLRFYRNRRFTAANIALTIGIFSMFGTLFLLTQYWQLVHGYRPFAVGVRLIPYGAVMFVVSNMAPRLVERFGTKYVAVTGITLNSVSFLGMSFLHVDSSYLRVILNWILTGVGMGLTLAPCTESIMGSLPRDKAGVGSAVNDTTRQVGGALGVAVIGSVALSTYARHVADGARQFALTPAQLSETRDGLGNAINVSADLTANTATFVDMARHAFMHGLAAGYRIGAATLAVGAVVVWRYLPARAEAAALVPTGVATEAAV
ncbi:MAG: MFS transporter [Acidimicrobiia bacterium]